MCAMMARHLQPNPTLTERFGHLLYWLFEGMGLDWRRRGLQHVHSAEIGQRIMGLWRRLRLVIARWEAGTLVVARVPGLARQPTESTPHPNPPPQGGREKIPTPGARWAEVLPRRFGWLRALLLPATQGYAVAFQTMLHEDAEMRAVIAAAPREMGRVLRPFCHLLGIAVPEELRLPRRVRAVRESDPSPRPSPTRGEGEESAPTPALPRSAGEGEVVAARRRRRTAREIAQAWMAWSERTGKAIPIGKVSSIVWGYIVHWPRDGNCPPPEIGYGGRSWRPPKDYRPPRDWE
jgi:hypothetical protein